MSVRELFPGVYEISLKNRKFLATKNLVPGKRVYGEQLIRVGEVEYRAWNPYRSKLAAAILKGLSEMPVKPGQKILYLGAATGTTSSHVSDIVGDTGLVYCVEFAPRMMRDLLNVCSFRKNMIPIFADARLPEQYRMVVGKVDGIYCDIAQPEQAKPLADNADMFLKEGGWILLAIKAMSIDVTERPSEIFKREIDVLKERGFDIKQVVHLEPFDKAHAMVYARR